ncbi:MAG: hypothetical protein PHE59_00875 [Patescibacteria group bacterium]|nr:hypothetical protein [Patescibacteria group bacterium]MDD5164711.1 hypothetical protein [Patescibacteria group bacterium]MDD5534187.1 hypothetical protein [Patescibacteria group bacterium]
MLLAIAVAVVIAILWKVAIEEKISSTIIAGIVTFVIMLFIDSIVYDSVDLFWAFKKESGRLTTQSLVALRDKSGSETRGDFFIGTGNIETDNKMFYYYYYRTSDGGIKFGKVSVDSGVTIYEEDRNDGVIEMQEIVNKKIFIPNTFWKKMICFGSVKTTKIRTWKKPNKITIRIPKGSIKSGLNLNLGG